MTGTVDDVPLGGGELPSAWPTIPLLGLTFSLAFMQPPVALLGFTAVPTDFLFVITVTAWVMALLHRSAPFVWSRAYAILAVYFVALAVSVVFSESPKISITKLLTQTYLLAMPVMVCNLVRNLKTFKLVIFSWLLGTAVVIVIGMASILLFFLEPSHPLLSYTRFHFGSLAPGDYPRLRLTYLNANMLCNYLTVSFSLLICARWLHWLPKAVFVPLLAGTLLLGALTFSPGIGGFAFATGIWTWALGRQRRTSRAWFSLAVGLLVSIAFIGAMTVTPILHQTAPFLIRVDALDLTLAPSGRLLVWIDALQTFAANPFFGKGLGTEPVSVPYLSPSGLQVLADAHNSFLSIAAQCGLLGIASMFLLLGHVARASFFSSTIYPNRNFLKLMIGAAFLNGFAYQGLGGSYEDARHLWFLFGLLLAAESIPPCASDK